MDVPRAILAVGAGLRAKAFVAKIAATEGKGTMQQP